MPHEYDIGIIAAGTVFPEVSKLAKRLGRYDAATEFHGPLTIQNAIGARNLARVGRPVAREFTRDR